MEVCQGREAALTRVACPLVQGKGSREPRKLSRVDENFLSGWEQGCDPQWWAQSRYWGIQAGRCGLACYPPGQAGSSKVGTGNFWPFSKIQRARMLILATP